ncbi:MAG: hypothetical protein AABY18_07060 [Candidatus Thermoplasmatota archaeon]
MRVTPWACLSLTLLALAGCLADDEGDGPLAGPESDAGVPSVSAQRLPDPAQPDAFWDVIVGDHGAPEMHHIRSLHTGLEYGMTLAGWDPLTDKLPAGSVGTGWGAAGLWHQYACVAQFAGTGAIAIVDLTDPANLVVVSQVDDPLVNGDCQFTADGNYLLAGAYLGPGPNPQVGEQPVCDRGCPGGGGINVWDVKDKANPVHVLYTNTGEYHTLQLHTDPKTNQTFVIQAYSGHIYRFDPDGPVLIEVNTTTPMQHDMWIAKHPISGKQLLYTGDGGGFIIYDFDDPAAPMEIGRWNPEDDELASKDTRGGCCGWHRHATVDQLIDGKAIVVVAGEACNAGYTLPYFMVDVTDPAAPVALSQWEIPGKPVSTDAEHLCEMSPHEFAVYDGYVVTGNYHAGVWLFDIGSAERLLDPVTLGYYVPAKEPVVESLDPLAAQDLTFPWNPFVWGAFFDDRGYILAGDFSSGIYLLEIPGVTQVP